MTDPNETNEELSLDNLKSVSGGVSGAGIDIPRVTRKQTSDRDYNDPKTIYKKTKKKGQQLTADDFEISTWHG